MLVSRVTDPAVFCLVGLPPWDILEDLAAALRAKGLDVDQVFERSVKCSNEFIYDPCRSGGLKDRFTQKFNSQRTIPISWRSLAASLNPQPVAFAVIRRVLDWIDRCDDASKQNLPAPPFEAEDGTPIFPPEGSEDECRPGSFDYCFFLLRVLPRACFVFIQCVQYLRSDRAIVSRPRAQLTEPRRYRSRHRRPRR